MFTETIAYFKNIISYDLLVNNRCFKAVIDSPCGLPCHLLGQRWLWGWEWDGGVGVHTMRGSIPWSSADMDVAIKWVIFKMRLERFNSVQSLSPV